MKGVLNKAAIWVTKYQSGESSRKSNMGFAKVFFFLAKVHDQYILLHVYTQWDLVSLLTVVVFSDRQLQHRSQFHSLPKHPPPGQPKTYIFAFQFVQRNYGFLRKFRESSRKYSRKTGCPTQRFSSMSYYILHFPNLMKIPGNN